MRSDVVKSVELKLNIDKTLNGAVTRTPVVQAARIIPTSIKGVVTGVRMVVG